MAKIDIRPTLPKAVKTKVRAGVYVWMINGVRHNFVMSANKFGEVGYNATFEDKFGFKGSAYLLASYNDDKLAGVFLPCDKTDPTSL